jgi:putative phosphotransacetylase
MNTSESIYPSASVDQEILNRIVKEVFERLQLDSGKTPVNAGMAPVEIPASQDHGVSGHPMKIPVGVSVRHIHISQKDLETLFGPGAELHQFRELYQPGEYAAQEAVSLVGPKMRILEKVRILGPVRDRTQVELARTDAIFLGVDAPVRMSGDIKGSAPITLVGPKGVVELKEGCIRAMRHIHMNPKEAAAFGLKNGDIVKLRVGGPSAVTFENVVVRLSDKVRLQVHLDTDEGNVADVHCNQGVEIIKE